jgi:SPP1 family predicted phage head-tail adaptor
VNKNVPVQLQRLTTTQDGAGEQLKAYATYATVWASVKTLRAGQYYAAQQTANETAVEIFIWHRSDVQADDRAIMRGVTYEVSGPPENLNMENRELLLRLRHVQ